MGEFPAEKHFICEDFRFPQRFTANVDPVSGRYLEDGDSKDLRNVGNTASSYTVLVHTTGSTVAMTFVC
jgi:hypothetical protein